MLRRKKINKETDEHTDTKQITTSIFHFTQATSSYISTPDHIFLQGASINYKQFHLTVQGRRTAFLHALGLASTASLQALTSVLLNSRAPTISSGKQ